ncbi:uncharacterized protein LOC127721250 [Mytilus californianus]|uniref:uncharacterized protein LOC127721250 n=1 Tax=Mytilus californianus TaxID=6549 RepID=UPI002247C193|nr:uncharacterized protein LOC127721250 [Mytilus californianus]
MGLIRKLKSSWLPSSILLGMFLCWYMLHLIQNTPGRDPDPHSDEPKNFPVIFDSSPQLRIIVLTYNRSKSLKRLFDSLLLTDYQGERVVLDIWVDRSINGEVHNETVQFAKDFQFVHGEKNVYVRGQHAGIINQWLRTWKLSDNPREICVILEDDLTVSPVFYQWLKSVHSTYKDDNKISGFTLQGVGSIYSGPSALENVNVSKKHLTYLYSMPGSWGFSPKLNQWKEFITWWEKMSLDKSFHPLVPNNLATVWYSENRRQGNAQNMWTMWFIYFNWKFHKYVLYPNIMPKYKGFSYNWQEPGLNHFGHAGLPSTGPLVVKWLPEFDSLSPLPPIVFTNGTVLNELNRKITV